ncbi:MAG: YicC family protein [Deltaproteobacteria bacterium]|nr:YicC family protein [Deltaproteobacteria bacterium]
MINSMTAYAAAESSNDKFSVHTEIRSYNHKYLDIILRTHRRYELLEEKIKALITEKISRGRTEVRIKIEDTAEQTQNFEINESMAKAYYDALKTLKKSLGLDGPLSLDLFAAANGMIVPVEDEANIENAWPVIRESVITSVNELNIMRQREGEFIAGDIHKRIDYIEKSIDQIEETSSDIPARYRDRLQERIATLTKGIVDLDPGRVTQEAALLADRSDISEEIVRSKSHIKQFRSIMDSPEPAGRKLNFLLQEFNREFNTIGSKAGNADVSHTIVEVKAELEKIREQVQNIE